jgi:thiamine biosynthesis lipoprotein
MRLVATDAMSAQSRRWAAFAVACAGSLSCTERAAPLPTKPQPSATPPLASAPDGPPRATPRAVRRLVRDGQAMGTVVTVQLFAPEDATLAKPAETLLDDAFLEIRRLETLLSTWVADSEISQVNAHAAERPVHVGPDALAVLQRSQWASEVSRGAFDITFEVMHGLWRFDHDRDGAVPEAAAIAAKRAQIDYRSVVLDLHRSEVRFRRSETKINLGGIAKGYAIDRMVAVLLDGGLRDFVVQAGGDLYAHGKKGDGSPWMVGVRDPRGPEGSFFGALPVSDHAFSTAGDYERSFLKDGKRYHHILDPRTGYPATATRSVTVWAGDALTADAIDDGIFVLGPEKGIPLCDAIDDCGAVVVDAANKVWVSRRLVGVFQQHRAPTAGL